jgi:hypothetical protein
LWLLLILWLLLLLLLLILKCGSYPPANHDNDPVFIDGVLVVLAVVVVAWSKTGIDVVPD